jgi:hypothetical protein
MLTANKKIVYTRKFYLKMDTIFSLFGLTKASKISMYKYSKTNKTVNSSIVVYDNRRIAGKNLHVDNF